jgi:hypothetical protein
MSYGYRNWQNNDKNFDDSYDDPQTASPPTYTSDPYGFELSDSYGGGRGGERGKGGGKTNQNKSQKKSSDLYDFDISHDDDISPKKTSQKSKPIRRMSTDDRMNEILEKAKIHKAQAAATAATTVNDNEEDEDAFNSWKSSWNQLIEGVGGSTGAGVGSPGAESDESLSPLKEKKPNIAKKKPDFDASDSFDISEGDFEVPCYDSIPLTSSYRLEHLLLDEVKKKEMKEELVELQWKLHPPNILLRLMSPTRSSAWSDKVSPPSSTEFK